MQLLFACLSNKVAFKCSSSSTVQKLYRYQLINNHYPIKINAALIEFILLRHNSLLFISFFRKLLLSLKDGSTGCTIDRCTSEWKKILAAQVNISLIPIFFIFFNFTLTTAYGTRRGSREEREVKGGKGKVKSNFSSRCR